MPLNLSAISKSTVLGRLARLPLRLVPPSARVRILQGPGKGLRWIAGAHTHGCWLGSYELPKQRLFARILAPGAVLYDIGANVGFYTLEIASSVGPTGRVLAFEPDPFSFELLTGRLRRTGALNVETYQLALGNETGHAPLYCSAYNRADNRLSPSHAEPHVEKYDAEVRTLDEVLRETGQAIDAMKIHRNGPSE